MPYGAGPKSGWSLRTAVEPAVVRPLIQAITCGDRESTGARLTSRFHQLVAGKTCRPASDSPSPGAAATAAAAAMTTKSTDAADTDLNRTTLPVSQAVPAAGPVQVADLSSGRRTARPRHTRSC